MYECRRSIGNMLKLFGNVTGSSDHRCCSSGWLQQLSLKNRFPQKLTSAAVSYSHRLCITCQLQQTVPSHLPPGPGHCREHTEDWRVAGQWLSCALPCPWPTGWAKQFKDSWHSSLKVDLDQRMLYVWRSHHYHLRWSITGWGVVNIIGNSWKLSFCLETIVKILA